MNLQLSCKILILVVITMFYHVSLAQQEEQPGGSSQYGNKTDWLLCNRYFEGQNYKHLLYELTGAWLGYDFDCFDSVHKTVSSATSIQTGTVNIVINIFIIVLCLYFPLLYLLLPDRYNTDEDAVRFYRKREYPYRFARFILQLHDTCKQEITEINSVDEWFDQFDITQFKPEIHLFSFMYIVNMAMYIFEDQYIKQISTMKFKINFKLLILLVVVIHMFDASQQEDRPGNTSLCEFDIVNRDNVRQTFEDFSEMDTVWLIFFKITLLPTAIITGTRFDGKEINDLTRRTWVPKKHSYLLTYPVDLAVITFQISTNVDKTISLSVNASFDFTTMSLQTYSICMESLYYTVLKNILSGNKSDWLFCNRYFEGQSYKHVFYALTGSWLGYDFVCFDSVYDSVARVKYIKKGTVNIVINIFIIVLCLYFPLLYLFLPKRYNIGKDDGQYYRKGEYPNSFSRLILRLHDTPKHETSEINSIEQCIDKAGNDTFTTSLLPMLLTVAIPALVDKLCNLSNFDKTLQIQEDQIKSDFREGPNTSALQITSDTTDDNRKKRLFIIVCPFIYSVWVFMCFIFKSIKKRSSKIESRQCPTECSSCCKDSNNTPNSDVVPPDEDELHVEVDAPRADVLRLQMQPLIEETYDVVSSDEDELHVEVDAPRADVLRLQMQPLIEETYDVVSSDEDELHVEVDAPRADVLRLQMQPLIEETDDVVS
ncbi:unnamed protein product [Mytilus edulis]|uniref:Uncharacterized protein n=1 Tax=Mytilus edulis TaxID=6550 RepID=A0A8S3QJN5_MYTED|nr:unnamed protein product [Mytilus edulis]